MSIVNDKPVSQENPLPTLAQNITTKFREAFESFDAERWNTPKKAAGDILVIDGNAVSSSYLAISLDPLTPGTETAIETIATFDMPVEVAIGLSTSQRALGQEFSVELVSTEDAIPEADPLDISSISQTTTTVTVNTVLPHGLVPGKRIGIVGVSDSRLNYASLVVQTIPSPTQFTANAGPHGTIASLTIGAINNSGQVYARPAMGGAPNGVSMIFENGSASNASFYARANAGDSLMSGSLNGSHSTTINTSASVQAINTAYTYAFLPTSEYRLVAMADSVQWFDAGVDTTGTWSNRYKRTQVIPDHTKKYKLRIRARNNRALPVPVAQIVSVTKTGTTTATVVTDRPHGLTTLDFINAFGVRDQTNFANLSTAAVVASVVNATTFTVVWGSAVTATSYGGFVSRQQGSQTIQGVPSQVIQTAAVSGGYVTLQMTAALSLSIGDLVNIVGVRDNASGASLNIDGAYRIRNIFTSGQFNVELEPIDGATPANLAQTNCGGAFIRRTDLRLSYVRVFDFERERVEMTVRPSGDSSNAMPVNIQNTAAVSQSSASNLKAQVEGLGAIDGTFPQPVGIGYRAANSNPAAMSAGGDQVGALATMIGAAVQKPYAIPEAAWNASLALSTTTAATIQGAAGAGLKRYVTAVQAINTGASAVDMIILDGTTERWRYTLPVNVPVIIQLPTELLVTANTAINANLLAAGTVRANFQGYTAP